MDLPTIKVARGGLLMDIPEISFIKLSSVLQLHLKFYKNVIDLIFINVLKMYFFI